MQLAAAIERLERVTATRANDAALRADLTAALSSCSELSSFIASSEADLTRRLAATVSFPESAIAESTRGSLSDAGKTLDRSRTLESTPLLAEALDSAQVTPGHIDALTRSAKGLEPAQRQQLFDRVDTLVDVAAHASVEQFGKRIRSEINRIMADDGIARLERQRRATSMSTWVDVEGMWNVRGCFDPVSGLELSSALDEAVERLFTETVPVTCPSDPLEKQRHLRALAFASLMAGGVGGQKPGRPKFVAVIDVHAPPASTDCRVSGTQVDDGRVGDGRVGDGRVGDGRVGDGRVGDGRVGDGLSVQWPIPIELPPRVIAEMLAQADLKGDITAVVVRNGVVLHAPGNLDLGRSTRLANRDQRRALRGLYSNCALPGCAVSYDRCKLHHIVWWRNGGATDLDNLIPVCSRHHHNIHDDGWIIDLDGQRALTLTLPDGTIQTTGPPRRLTA